MGSHSVGTVSDYLFLRMAGEEEITGKLPEEAAEGIWAAAGIKEKSAAHGVYSGILQGA